MKKRFFSRLLALLLALAALTGLAACGEPAAAPETGEVPEATAQTEPVAGVDFVPDRGAPDRSELLWTEAIEPYQKTDWTADWIWTRACAEDSYVAFRKSFTLEEEPGEVTACISAVDKYVLWVNGELIVLDGSLKRGPTPVDSYYDSVTVPNLRKGENVIALLVAFNGRSGDGSIVPVTVDADGDEVTQAGLLFEMQAGETLIKSDNSWRALRHNAYKNRVSGGKDYVKYEQSSMLAERNVWYKAEDDIGDFTAADYDDSAWENATLVARAGDLPFGGLFSAIIRPVKFSAVQPFADQESEWKRSFDADSTLVLRLPGTCSSPGMWS